MMLLLHCTLSAPLCQQQLISPHVSCSNLLSIFFQNNNFGLFCLPRLLNSPLWLSQKSQKMDCGGSINIEPSAGNMLLQIEIMMLNNFSWERNAANMLDYIQDLVWILSFTVDPIIVQIQMNYHIQWLQAKWYRMQPRLIFKAHDPVKAASNYTGNEIPCFSLKEDRQERLSSSLLNRGRL